MLKQMRTRLRRSWRLVIEIAALATLAAWGAGSLGLLAPLDDYAYDQALRLFSPRRGASEHLAVVGIDDRTFQGIARDPALRTTFGAWPYSRLLWARVLTALAGEGARAVVLDAVMDEPHPDRAGDVAMAEAVAKLPIPVFLGFSVNAGDDFHPLPRVAAKNRFGPLPPAEPPGGAPADDEDPFSDEAQRKLDPTPTPEAIAQALAFPVSTSGLALPKLLDGSPPRMQHPVPPLSGLLPVVSGFGLVLPEEESDGRIRRSRFAYADESNAYAELAVAAAADLLGAERLELSPGRLKLGSRELPINLDGTARLDYGGSFWERYQPVSLLEVLRDAARAQQHQPLRYADAFRGKVVVIGGVATGTYDAKSTPFDASVPGMAKQLAMLDSLLFGRFITDAPRWLSLAVAAALALASFALIFGLRALAVELVWPVLAVLGLFSLSGLLLARAQLFLPIATPTLALALSSFGAIALNHFFADRERERVRQMFNRYLSPHVVGQLVEQQTLPKLTGEDMRVTAFFSDIRGFSTFSEKYKDDPRALVKILNTYLTRVSAVLLQHGACLDKYIGDAIVCIFGAPVRHPDHAVRACRAALAAQEEVGRLREEFRREGLPDVYTRIGLNSAVMFVGNVGSEQLFNYTAIGDGMNLASRLEGANKSYGSAIMIGPQTWELARDFIEARELDRVRVAGKHEPVAVYELLAMKGELSERKRQVVALYHRALALYREARFEEALAGFEEALAVDPEDGPSQAQVARCRKLLLHPPPLPFDGVANLEK